MNMPVMLQSSNCPIVIILTRMLMLKRIINYQISFSIILQMTIVQIYRHVSIFEPQVALHIGRHHELVDVNNFCMSWFQLDKGSDFVEQWVTIKVSSLHILLKCFLIDMNRFLFTFQYFSKFYFVHFWGKAAAETVDILNWGGERLCRQVRLGEGGVSNL